MKSRPGCFIVIEGTDGSGKGTQFNLLVESLEKEGYDVASFDFPRYQEPSTHFVRKYLNGEYGTAEEVGPYTGSLFYALDRYEAAPEIKQALADGKIVLANRFTGSNMAHQGTKFKTDEERNGYFTWLDAIEFQMLGVPRPDLSIVLRVPADIAQGLVDQKDTRSYTDKKRDLHEADLSHLEKSVQVYDSLCKLFPKEFKALDCVRDGKLLGIPAIQKLVRETINPLLPPRRSQTATPERPDYVKPELDSETLAHYSTLLDSIIDAYVAMQSDLAAYLTKNNQNPRAAQQLLKPVLPVATQSEIIIAEPSNSPLGHAFSSDIQPVTLISASPRNELDLVSDILYESSGLSYNEIQQETSNWNYEQKSQLLSDYIENVDSPTALTQLRYEWDIVHDYLSVSELLDALEAPATPQVLTPRYGYAVPQVIIDAGISDTYEHCFDTSLKLYSILQSAGFEKEAQLATLMGHCMRIKLSCNALDLWQFSATSGTSLLTQMQRQSEELHPLITTGIKSRDTTNERSSQSNQ